MWVYYLIIKSISIFLNIFFKFLRFTGLWLALLVTIIYDHYSYLPLLRNNTFIQIFVLM